MQTRPLDAAELERLDAFLDDIVEVYRQALCDVPRWNDHESDDERVLRWAAERRHDIARLSLSWLDGIRTRHRASRRKPDGAAWAWARVVVAGCPSQPSRDGAWSFERIRPLARRWIAALEAGEVSAREVVGGGRIVGESAFVEPWEGCGGFRLLDRSRRAREVAAVAAEAIARTERTRGHEERRGLVVPPLADAVRLAAAYGGRLLDEDAVEAEVAVSVGLATRHAHTPLDRAAFAVNQITGLRMDDALSPWLFMWRGGDSDPGRSLWKQRGRVRTPSHDRRVRPR